MTNEKKDLLITYLVDAGKMDRSCRTGNRLP